MNVETKFWSYSDTGTKMHAFDNGKALCRPTITRPVGVIERTAVDYSTAAGRTCAKCLQKFNAELAKEEAYQARLKASMTPSNGEGDYHPPADRLHVPTQETPCCAHASMHHGARGCDECFCRASRTVAHQGVVKPELPVSDVMRDELIYAANLYQNSAGVVAYANRRTEDALLRRGFITYDTHRADNYPVITVKGWDYLASTGYKRRAEDPGRLRFDDALTEAYRQPVAATPEIVVPTLGNVEMDTETTVMLTVADAPKMHHNRAGGTAVANRMTVTYRYRQEQGADGWRHHEWHVVSVRIVGVSDSTSFNVGWWWQWDSRVEKLVGEYPAPNWLVGAIDHLRPSGEVALPRVKGH